MGPPIVGGKVAHRTSMQVRRLRMRRALGIQSSPGMCPASRRRGRDRRRGTWRDREQNCVAIEGQDFAQDTQEGGADRFELIPDSDEGDDNGQSLPGGDDEFVPETEPQEIVAVNSVVGRPSNNQGRARTGTLFNQWRHFILEKERCARQVETKEQNEVAACSKEEDHNATSKEDTEHKHNPKIEKEYEDNSKKEFHQNTSFSDMETDDEASWVQDGVDLRGHSQVEEDSEVQDGEDSAVNEEGDNFQDKVDELIIALFPAYRDVLRSAKR